MLTLKRVKENPLLSPTNLPWEDMLVFNPGVIKFKGEICLLYRAVSKADQVSRLGFAKSKDGIHFTRSVKPIYAGNGKEDEIFGVEDPRVVQIDTTYYLVYTAVSDVVKNRKDVSWENNIGKIPRIGLATTKDFIRFTDHDVILPKVTGKDACFFPKKPHGKYWLLYRSDEGATSFTTSYKLNQWNEGEMLFDKREGFWDSQKAGIGAPPIETEKGWLLFYHGVDIDNIYRLGIMILDLQDPRKILYRSPFPIMQPQDPFEKYGYVPNVVFTCGAIEMKNEYYVYYGAGDQVVGLATIAKKEILSLF